MSTSDHVARLQEFRNAWRAERLGSCIAFVVSSETGDRYALRDDDLRALLAENARLRMQNDELFTENHEMRYGPTVSAEEV